MVEKFWHDLSWFYFFTSTGEVRPFISIVSISFYIDRHGWREGEVNLIQSGS